MKDAKKISISDCMTDARRLEPISKEELDSAYGCAGTNWLTGNHYCCQHDCLSWIRKKASALFCTTS